jgi:subtilisin family serine protease
MSITPFPVTGRRPLVAAAIAVALVLAGAPLAPASAAPLPSTASSTNALPGVPEGSVVRNYIVNAGRQNGGQTKRVERAVVAAGGVIIASYKKIGVVVAQTYNPRFAVEVFSNRAVLSVGETRTAPVGSADPTWMWGDPVPTVAPSQKTDAPASGTGVQEVGTGGSTSAAGAPATPTTVIPDPDESLQWNLAAIGASVAHETTDGSSGVLVAVLDSGIEADHPDLEANVDPLTSANCLSGRPDRTPGSWEPTEGSHGTHVAGTIAAARNGVGIVGVAPSVKLASVKVVNDHALVYPEAAICGYMFAAAIRADIANSSFYIDPWQFWCDGDPDQAAVKTAVERAVEYSQRRGMVNVAAAGNSGIDLSNKTEDAGSPNDSESFVRDVSQGCEELPGEVDGVVTVAATAADGSKPAFSNYGLGSIDVAAPGTGILSTVNEYSWGWFSGTSMASPHVAGVLALLKSTHRDLSGQELVDLLYSEATDVPCPADALDCVGAPEVNGYFGEGLANAVSAVD